MVLRRTKCSLLARLALGAALCVSIAGSFGLHPEPPGVPGRLTAPEIATTPAAVTPTHGCIACMSGGTVVVWPALAVVLAATPCAQAPSCSEPLLQSRLAGRDLSGRSPPSNS